MKSYINPESLGKSFKTLAQIISIGSAKAFDKSPFKLKMLKELGMKRKRHVPKSSI